MKQICAVTGSRADWGLLRPVLHRLRSSPIECRLLVTGSHLDPAFGYTVDTITAEGFEITRRIPLHRQGDDTIAVADAAAMAVSGIARALVELKPELLLLLGDRYEIFAAAQAATIAGVPIAHIAGGDISEGANDDAMRHAITKLSHLHFTTNPAAARRVRQMGEMFESVFVTGSPGIDALLQSDRLDRPQLEHRLQFRLRPRNLAICFHPATLDPLPARQQVEPVLSALSQLDESTGLIFTAANADAGGTAINDAIQAFVGGHENACFVDSLGHAGYYALLEQADLLIGNSSSGLYEAPSVGTPTLDIGLRQQGRLKGPSVAHVASDSDAILANIRELLAHPPSDYTSPYGDGHASQRIVDVLLSLDEPRKLLVKRFTELST